MAEEVKLLGYWASPFSNRIELALRLKGVEFEFVQQDLTNKSRLLLESNPVHKKIPVLIHNGKPIAESLVILEYIDETWTTHPLLPNDPYDRAMARFWAKFVDEEILQTAVKLSTSQGKEQEQAWEDVLEKLKLLENELKENELFGGDGIGYLDVVVFFLVRWLMVRQEAMEVNLINEESVPVLLKWVQKLLNIDVVNKCVPLLEKHLAFTRARIASGKPAFSSDSK